MDANHYKTIYESHNVMVAQAETEDERRHWEAEADRFHNLYLLAIHNPKLAREYYRPTRPYEPTTCCEAKCWTCGNLLDSCNCPKDV